MHIVIVEDNQVLAKSVVKVLKETGYSVTHFDNGEKGLEWLTVNRMAYDLVILDILLPGMNGFEVCKNLRAEGIETPFLMLTSKDAPSDIVQGLDVGADDYLKKPFLFEELLARIRALLRRQNTLLHTEVRLTPDVTIDLISRKILKKGKEVALTAKEFAILSYFLYNPDKVISQQEIYDHVFDYAEVQLSNTVEVHMKNIRKKLRTDNHELPITTIKAAGYRLDI